MPKTTTSEKAALNSSLFFRIMLVNLDSTKPYGSKISYSLGIVEKLTGLLFLFLYVSLKLFHSTERGTK